jgi:hypothetical protein
MVSSVLSNMPNDLADSLPKQVRASTIVDTGAGRSLYGLNYGHEVEFPQETPSPLIVIPAPHNGDELPPSGCPTEKDRLRLNISHPLERCPFEVLQLIFEATSDMMFDPFAAALPLSAVCRKWRKIALDTPRLWREIRLDLDLGHDPSHFCNLIIPRIKMCPAIIKIHDLGIHTASILERCDLKRIPVLEHLAIYLTDPGYFLQLHTLPPFFPFDGAQYLLVSCSSEGQPLNQEADVIWDIGRLLQHIPISKLWLATPCTLLFSPCNHFSAITFLYLERMREVDVLTIISLFTQLSHLEMYDVEFTKTTSLKETNSQSLTSLAICDCVGDDSWLAQVAFPTLAIFIHAGPRFSGLCLGFIQKHTSIVELELSEKGESLSIIPKIAPQIQSLVMDPWLYHLYKGEPSGTHVHPFPRLQSLTVATEMAPLSLEDFDGIVCARCLPISHSQSKIPTSFEPLRSLNIRRNVGEDETAASEPWRDSAFLQSARQEVTVDTGWGMRENVSLSWI